MNVTYFIVSLVLDEAAGVVIVGLRAANGDTARVQVLQGSPAVAQLTIGRQVNAVFSAA